MIGCNENGCGSLVCKSVECTFAFQMNGSFVIANAATIYVPIWNAFEVGFDCQHIRIPDIHPGTRFD